jgi:cyanophycinase-like exopeptidase
MKQVALVSLLLVTSFALNTTKQDLIRIVVGGSLLSNSPILDYYKGFAPNGVKYITMAGINPTADATEVRNFFARAGITAEWIPVFDNNCAARTRDPTYIRMVESADAIYMSGGQSGRIQSCLFGSFQQNGVNDGTPTPFLNALLNKAIVGGSSAGAMNQALSEILITGSSAESYAAVRAGTIFQRNRGNNFITNEELVDVHFSERGRQGRLMVFAAQTRQRFAYGVDENVAYVWSPSGVYEIVGQSPRGVVIYEATTGDTRSQKARMHFLTPGDKFNPSTGQVTWNPDKTRCTGNRPTGSTQVFNGVNYRTISIAMSKTAPGTTLSTTHGAPAVRVEFASLPDTMAMCGRSGDGFINLEVTQFQSNVGSETDPSNSTEVPELPLDYMWQVDE